VQSRYAISLHMGLFLVSCCEFEKGMVELKIVLRVNISIRRLGSRLHEAFLRLYYLV
jgi:hypothetical protein